MGEIDLNILLICWILFFFFSILSLYLVYTHSTSQEGPEPVYTQQHTGPVAAVLDALGWHSNSFHT